MLKSLRATQHMVIAQKKGPRNTTILITGPPKRVPQNFGNPYMLRSVKGTKHPKLAGTHWAGSGLI